MVTSEEMLMAIPDMYPEWWETIRRPEMALLLMSRPDIAAKLFDGMAIPPPKSDAEPIEIQKLMESDQRLQREGSALSGLVSQAVTQFKSGFRDGSMANTAPPPQAGPPRGTAMGRPVASPQTAPIGGLGQEVFEQVVKPAVQTAVGTMPSVREDLGQTPPVAGTPQVGAGFLGSPELPGQRPPAMLEEALGIPLPRPRPQETTGTNDTEAQQNAAALLDALGMVQAPPQPEVQIPAAISPPRPTAVSTGNVPALLARMQQQQVSPQQQQALRLLQAIGAR